MTDLRLTLLQQVAQGQGLDPDLQPELDRLEEAGLLEVHYKHRDPDTGSFDHIVALLTSAGWDLVAEANAAPTTHSEPGPDRQAG